MSGLIGKKVGMTSIFDEIGRSIPVTVIEIEPCTITQIKTKERDGYEAVQVAAFDKKPKNVSKALKGHFAKAGVEAKKLVKEFRDYIPEGLDVGDDLSIDDVFNVGDRVDVVGKSKGTGFTGVMKRHNFRGVGDATHGQHNRDRAPGSIGQASDPSRVFKGVKMAGRSGNARTKITNLSIAKILSDSNMILVTGSVPGPKGGYLEIYNKTEEA
ncbi:MAG TPA: 50S ribosomal protein L3 [Balneolaceae bacterium]|mgnify:CR=1 FL=1|jgi:large subunit ribosomal protein L3|nr:50S ribosomal protein L3 [Balneolaceae bacterium]